MLRVLLALEFFQPHVKRSLLPCLATKEVNGSHVLYWPWRRPWALALSSSRRRLGPSRKIICASSLWSTDGCSPESDAKLSLDFVTRVLRECGSHSSLSDWYWTDPYLTNPYQTNPYRTEPYQTDLYQTEPQTQSLVFNGEMMQALWCLMAVMLFFF